MYNKRYDAALKNQYDPQGKRVANEIMSNVMGAELIRENIKEDQGDFSEGFWDQSYRTKNNEEIKVEPEIKNSKWFGSHFSKKTGFPFQYDSVDIPYRKEKCIADIHMVISSCENFAFVVSREAMDRQINQNGGNPKFKKTKYEPEGAYYFSVPLDKGIFVTKKDKRWKRWS